MAAEAPATCREDISPFLFPCSRCRMYLFHSIFEQPCGLAFKIPFTKTPLWSSHTGYHLVCLRCNVINGQVGEAVVKKLEGKLLPKDIYNAYPALHAFYQPGYYEVHRAELIGEPVDPEFAQLADKWMRTYRIEI